MESLHSKLLPLHLFNLKSLSSISSLWGISHAEQVYRKFVLVGERLPNTNLLLWSAIEPLDYVFHKREMDKYGISLSELNWSETK